MRTRYLYFLIALFSLSVVPLLLVAHRASYRSVVKGAVAGVVPASPDRPGANNAKHTTRYRVAGELSPIKQQKKFGCWATAATMLDDWRKQSREGPEAFLATLPPLWLSLYLDGDHLGLNRSQKVEFLAAANLRFEWGMSYSVEGLKEMLVRYGPLWFTVNRDDFNSHATVVIGLSGSNRIDDTYIVYIDPADGLEHEMQYAIFMHWYESLAAAENAEMAGDAAPSYSIQVVHCPDPVSR